MEIGDRRKATTLSVVAVGAIGFLFLRLLPGSAAASGAPAAAGDRAASTTSASQMSLRLVRDPFSDERLATKTADEKPEAPPSAPEGKPVKVAATGISTSPPPPILGEVLPLPTPNAPVGPVAAPPSRKEAVLGSRAVIAGKPLTVRLNAIMKIREPLAVLTVNGVDLPPSGAPSRPAAEVEIVAIGAGSARLRLRGQAVSLAVGEERSR